MIRVRYRAVKGKRARKPPINRGFDTAPLPGFRSFFPMRGYYRVAMGIDRDSPRIDIRVPVLSLSRNTASLVAKRSLAPCDDVVNAQIKVFLDSIDAEYRRMEFIQVLE